MILTVLPVLLLQFGINPIIHGSAQFVLQFFDFDDLEDELTERIGVGAMTTNSATIPPSSISSLHGSSLERDDGGELSSLRSSSSCDGIRSVVSVLITC